MKTNPTTRTPPTFPSHTSPTPPTRTPPPAPTGHSMESSFEAASSSKQLRDRPPAARASRERLDALLRPGTLEALNPSRGFQNCPSTAGAVDHFLRTGEIRPADRGDGLVDYTFTNRFTDTSIEGLRHDLSHDGDFAVVRGIRDPATAAAHNLSTEHYFVVVNDGGELRAVDAFNHRVRPLDEAMSAGMLDHLQRTTGEFNPQPRDPIGDSDLPPM